MITGVLSDRLMRRNEAVADITSSWGKEQNVLGPVLGIPYQYRYKAVKEIPLGGDKVERREVEETAIANAYFLPEALKITGDVQTQKLHRGIYEAAVFRGQVMLTGRFTTPDFGALKIDMKDVRWKDAFVTIALNDMRGTREGIMLDCGGTKNRSCPAHRCPVTRPAQRQCSAATNRSPAQLSFPSRSTSTGAEVGHAPYVTSFTAGAFDRSDLSRIIGRQPLKVNTEI